MSSLKTYYILHYSSARNHLPPKKPRTVDLVPMKSHFSPKEKSIAIDGRNCYSNRITVKNVSLVVRNFGENCEVSRKSHEADEIRCDD